MAMRKVAAMMLLLACPPASGNAQDVTRDTIEARRLFEANIASIHRRDRAAYLATYLQNERLARNGPGGLETGFDNWPARRDTTWPDTLVARDLRVVPVSPGVVYGSYHYRVTQRGMTTEGRSERVFVRTPTGWKIAVSTAFPLPHGAMPPALAIVGATLVNPGSAPIPNAVIVTRNGRIACAGARPQCTPPADAEIVNASGQWAIPGLIDAHVHYSQTAWAEGRPDALDMRDRFPYDSVVSALRAHPEHFHRAFLCSGVTSVFDVGGFPWTIPLAERSAGALNSPRVVAAGPLLTTRDHWLNTPSMKQFVHMTSDSAVRRAVHANATFGAGATKVWYIQLPEAERPGARALLEVAAAESRKAGLPLIVHATQRERAREAIQAGAKVLVHSIDDDTLDRAFLDLARSNGVIVIPTLTVREGYADMFMARSPESRYPLACVRGETRERLRSTAPQALRERGMQTVRSGVWDRQRVTMEENLRRMHAAGVRIAMGTDAGNPGTAHGPSVYREMEAMQKAGMSASGVLESSTIVAARAAGIGEDTGSLEPGKRADIVLLTANPLADISNVSQVSRVIRNGALYGRAELLPR
jgi:imidazolonepropionase-like amidohydrolase